MGEPYGPGCRQDGAVPIDPGSSPWVLPTPDRGAGDLIAFGADLEPATLLAAYRAGLFPMPVEEQLGWWSPERRGVLPLGGLRVSRSLRRSVRRYRVSVDEAFADVVAGCADPSREGAWIDVPMAAAYRRLHDLGWAHSVETWDGDRLVGGLYGIAVGGLFAGESMFSRADDASKVALVHLVELLGDEYADRRVLDTQWQTPHLASLGVIEIDRDRYLDQVRTALTVPLPARWA
jgi:leucyl/phenylalanyl-tRNA--protein transferase